MEFSLVGHTNLAFLYQKLRKEMDALNAKGVNVQSPKGMRKLLTDFEGRSLLPTSERVDEFLELTFFFEIDWVLTQDIQYHAPNLTWVYHQVERSDCNRGLVRGSLHSWIMLSKLDTQFQLAAHLHDFVLLLKQNLGQVL